MNHYYSPFPLTTGTDNLSKFMVRVKVYYNDFKTLTDLGILSKDLYWLARGAIQVNSANRFEL